MTIGYYPGCTLKTKAKNLEDAALASLAALGVEVTELERWNCCGAVFALSDDDLLHQLAPVRVLIRAKDAGHDKVMTLCSQCYNTLARANELVRGDEAKRHTLNTFMTEESDYAGEVEVVHLLELLRDQVGWDNLAKKVKVPLKGLKVAPFYGCSLIRPQEVAVGRGQGKPTLLQELITALGGEPVDYDAVEDCCGSYQVLINVDQGAQRAGAVLASAGRAGAEALVLSCPLCDYNLGKRQPAVRALAPSTPEVPVYYFTQLLAAALGLADSLRLDLNMEAARSLLATRALVATV